MSENLLDRLQAAQDGYRLLGALASYDAQANGPLLGVSDSGWSSALIVDAAASSAKVAAGGDAAANGLIVDAERMGSAGEVPVGPDEYADVAGAALGRAWFTTNVGVRSNARFLQTSPELDAASLMRPGDDPLKPLKERFAPYLKPPGDQPRPLTVYLRIDRGTDLGRLGELVQRIEGLRGEALAGPDTHRVGLLSIFEAAATQDDVDWLERVIRWAGGAGIPTVAVHAPPVEAARIRLSVQGLLQVLEPGAAARLLAAGASHGVTVEPRFRVDTESVMRTIWAGLHTARTHGLSAAKYGLTPLTFSEQRDVIGTIQRWTQGWTAIPAFYADTPLVTDDDIYLSDRVVEASVLWIEMAREQGAQLVLFDCPDRFVPRIDSDRQDAGRRLLRSDPQDAAGAYTFEHVEQILDRASDLGVRILWSGGIGHGQAFELARRGVTGIFTTSSTARPGPVSPVLANDPVMYAENAPTRSGVRRVHALIQAGALISRLAEQHHERSDQIEALCAPVQSAALESDELRGALDRLDEALTQGWRLHWGT